MNEELVKTIIEDINKFEQQSSSTARSVGVAIHTYLSNVDKKEKRQILKTIKESKELKLSPSFVYFAYTMVRKFPEMINPSWNPLPNLTISHYIEVSRYKLAPGMEYQILQNASDFSWSIRELKDDIANFRNESHPQDLERRETLKEIYKELKGKSNAQLVHVLNLIKQAKE